MVWINEIDSGRNMNELKSCNSTCGRMIPDFEVLDSKIASALQKASLNGRAKGITGKQIPQKMTNCLHVF